ncbi:hypothetical protein GCM10022235_86040 [Kribbella ginsengisoli]|uniref:Uncharacterized protein n=1 Tax=Kribbella ginsengisoli TaxID=363865 RepID=A0ABP6Z855_9ACTN
MRLRPRPIRLLPPRPVLRLRPRTVRLLRTRSVLRLRLRTVLRLRPRSVRLLRAYWSALTARPLWTRLPESTRLSTCTGPTCLRWLAGHPIRPRLTRCPIRNRLTLKALWPPRTRLPLQTNRPTLPRRPTRSRPPILLPLRLHLTGFARLT